MTVKFPVLVMTASIMDAQVDRDRYPNVVDVLIKPFSATRLMTAIERALRHADYPVGALWIEFWL